MMTEFMSHVGLAWLKLSDREKVPSSSAVAGSFSPVAFSLVSCEFHEYGYNINEEIGILKLFAIIAKARQIVERLYSATCRFRQLNALLASTSMAASVDSS